MASSPGLRLEEMPPDNELMLSFNDGGDDLGYRPVMRLTCHERWVQ